MRGPKGSAARGGQQVVHEFLRSQIETNSAVHDSVAGVREGLKAARQFVVERAAGDEAAKEALVRQAEDAVRERATDAPASPRGG